MVEEPPRRRRRRAVGPPGARPAQDPTIDLTEPIAQEPEPDDGERLRREQPPHHDRGV